MTQIPKSDQIEMQCQKEIFEQEIVEHESPVSLVWWSDLSSNSNDCEDHKRSGIATCLNNG